MKRDGRSRVLRANGSMVMSVFGALIISASTAAAASEPPGNPPAAQTAAPEPIRRVRLTPVKRQVPEPPEGGAEPTPVPEDERAAPEPRADDSYTGPRGIHLFPPPGTSPPHPGIIVPEDFELPPGYMRHYQTTDDGQSLRAILMFHPDYDFVDEQGHPVQIPEDRVVPPELAPPGLPIDVLEVPTVTYPTPPTKDLKRLLGEKP